MPFHIEGLTIGSYTYWDGNLILAQTGQESSYREENKEGIKPKSEFNLIKSKFSLIQLAHIKNS